MGGVRAGLLGTEADAVPRVDSNASLDVLGGGDPPGTLGIDDPIPLHDPSNTDHRARPGVQYGDVTLDGTK
jgi:hypothetical protein